MICMKFLVCTDKFDWRIVTDAELRTMLNNKEFKIFSNGFADLNVSVLREDLGRLGSVYPVNVRYQQSGWVVMDLNRQVFLREEH